MGNHLKLDNIVSAYNDDPNYESFVHVFEQNCITQFGIRPLIIPIKQKHTKYPSANHAKVTRMWHAAAMSGNTMVLDIDMIVIDGKRLLEHIESVPENKMMALGYNHRAFVGIDQGKFPMCYTTASQATWRKMIKFQGSELYWLESIQYMKMIDNRERIVNDPKDFSDESLLRALSYKTETRDKIEWVERIGFDSQGEHDRLCRSNWVIDRPIGEYFDCHPHKPLDRRRMKPVLEHLGLV